MRASMLEVINSDYVRTARAKGLNERKVIMRHAFRNALIPLVTVVALNFGGSVGGAVITETVFQLDGMGQYFITALGAGDPYPIMAWLMIHVDHDRDRQPARRHPLRRPRPADAL